ncbi:aminotransferase class V-fold PLP-dependent enzyme [Novosphingobium album (ex Liu et al. 2023)]|uniref:Aminotransferase class V-fold PLP-dependent enzyme n=1 Tax=Novosphingobium album (ex Liu et al. 2023) TaxID=3031130 RepID=A0ABT5WQE3_9SPHN|nr:aminotransferase class V-fold PLP-dependent enzyme [Novosphingobium album (ex Liu et al. 2023)]MDE8651507.1 aminotransferase class V-fold PLP-dependent enzyme [Novosphingobium album (ex Liu et al. 2023)]
MQVDRRTLLIGAATAPVANAFAASPTLAGPATGSGAGDDAFWREIAAQYDVTREVIQLENGNWGMMPRPVQARYLEETARVNRDTSYYARRGMGRDMRAVQERLAAMLGVPPGEIAFTRNATEALKALIGGYNRLQAGDAVLYADLDYDAMQNCMDRLARRHGASVVRIALPEPASRQALIDAYAQAFEANPRIRLVLLTHLGHRTGLVIPVREIAAMARARGIDAIVDAAHSWCQIDFALPDLDCDFVGLNGHKWLTAPLGVGIVHIRGQALDRIDHDLASDMASRDTLGERVHTGTVNAAALLAVPAAIDFHERIGSARKAARLRALRDRWVARARGIAGVEILTPDDPALHGAITSFRLTGRTSGAENEQIVQRLLEAHRIFTVQRGGVHNGACVRVTPALFNTFAEMDALARAIEAIRS